MTLLDWLVIAVAVLAAVHGSLRGFLVGAVSLAGFLLGALAGSRLGPALLPDGSRSPYAPLLALVAAIFIGAVVATLARTVALRLRSGVRISGLGAADALLGAVLGAAVALTLVWLAGAVALQTPGMRQLRSEVQRSRVLRALNDALPPSGAVLHALARFDALPAITGPSTAAVAPPDHGILAAPGIRAARRSTVKILAESCGLGIEGSGWIAGPQLVVTNAHVVAGTLGHVVVRTRTGDRTLPARAVLFDRRNDLAVLAVPGLVGPSLSLAADTAQGTAGAILGYPQDGPFDARAARLGATQTVISQDAYGRGPVHRLMTAIRGTLRHGNSGGPVVNARGEVLATVFAANTDGGPAGGYGVPNAVVAAALAGARASGPDVSTGPCT